MSAKQRNPFPLKFLRQTSDPNEALNLPLSSTGCMDFLCWCLESLYLARLIVHLRTNLVSLVTYCLLTDDILTTNFCLAHWKDINVVHINFDNYFVSNTLVKHRYSI
ncbi:hypothetical protein BS78_04G133200 [Paspalum vaginatum]|nr:hypothetical protein BS78_04G133200 [Paspalum vaginatum]